MYHTCLYCHGDLGSNQVLAHFPVGRRIAFDPARGRLWVVCRRCRRWNLSPLETRWEAVEECERLFATLRRRVGTDDVSLAWARGGVELVRIGPNAGAGELAAWRYGGTLLRRRMRAAPVLIGLAALVALVAVGVVGAGAWGGLVAASFAGIWLEHLIHRHRPRDIVVGWVQLRSGGRIPIRDGDVRSIRVTPGTSGPYQVRVMSVEPEARPTTRREARWAKRRARLALTAGAEDERRADRAIVSDAEDERIARFVLPYLNPYGGSSARVKGAIRLLEEAGGSSAYLTGLGQNRARVRGLPAEHRLAFEMAFSEESERAALDGELEALEREWADAEEVARVADTLGLPGRLMGRLRGGG